MSMFPQIDPNDPLAVAAREVNGHAEEHGLEETLQWLGIEAGARELAYLCEQRAIRAIAVATLQHNMGHDPVVDETIAKAIVATPMWEDMRMLLIGCYMDGIAIGVRSAQT